MTLANKIIEGRRRAGLSQEGLAERLSVSRQAVSKWESAQAMPDIERVIELAALFGVSTDYLLKDEMESPDETCPACVEQPTRRKVTLTEANTFLAARKRASRFIAAGVALAVFSPVLLIFLAGFADAGIGGVTEGLAAALGLAFLLVSVAVAVSLFVVSGRGTAAFIAIREEPIEPMPGVADLAREKRAAYDSVYTAGLAVGIGLCILAVVPLLIAGAMDAPDYLCTSMIALLLAIAAVGVYLIVCVSTVRGSFDTLLQEGDYSDGEKRAVKTLQLVSGAYWCLATAGYLGWSFASGNWQFTWIVWPVAGVLFAAVMLVARLVIGRRNDR